VSKKMTIKLELHRIFQKWQKFDVPLFLPAIVRTMYTSVQWKSIHLHFACVNQINHYLISLSMSVAGNWNNSISVSKSVLHAPYNVTVINIIGIILYFQGLLLVLLSLVSSKFVCKFLPDNLIWVNMETNIK
jgi:hypothetical protein